MADEWYKDGLRFRCMPGCTACCREKGVVFLTVEDLERIRAFLGDEAFRGFEAKLGSVFGCRVIPTEEFGGCPMLGEGGCTINGAKPAQCRSFPFWRKHVGSEAAWAQVQKRCPGVGVGEVHPADEIKRAVMSSPI